MDLVPTAPSAVAVHRRQLAARRAQLRAGLAVDVPTWATIHADKGPFPNPTMMWGMGSDGFPVILELNNPTVGTLVCMSDADRRHLMAALLLSLAYLNDPDVVTACVVTDTPERWAWARGMNIPNLSGIDRPDAIRLGEAAASAYRESRYLVILADGDRAAGTLPTALLQQGPANGLWPLVFCTPQAGLRLAARSQPMRWTPVVGPVTAPLPTGAYPLVQTALPPADGLQPGQWRIRIRNRLLRFSVPLR